MNAPFKPDIIVPILDGVGVSISDFKRNPATVVAAARGRQIAVLNRNRPVAYVISPEFMERAMDAIEELEDIALVERRLADPGDREAVSIDDLV